MPTIRFVHANGTVELPEPPRFPVSNSHALLQPDEKSTGGEPLPCDYRAKKRIEVLDFPDMRRTTFNSLKTFFTTTVKGMHEIFTYKDADGGSWSRRFAYPHLEWSDVDHDTVAVKIYLMEG